MFWRRWASGLADLPGHGDTDRDQDQENEQLLHEDPLAARDGRLSVASVSAPRRPGNHCLGRRRGRPPSPGRGPVSTTTPTVGPEPGVLYAERLSASPRSWIWLLVAAGVTFFAIGPVIVPLTLVAWLINVARYANSSVRIDADRVWVGKRSARLAVLDLSTLGRASNTWPWRTLSARYLGANPIWT